MHNAGFNALGMNAVYVPLEAADVDDFVDLRTVETGMLAAPASRRRSRSGCSRSVGETDRDGADGSAPSIRSSCATAEWIGANTDVEGFLAPLDRPHGAEGHPRGGARGRRCGAGRRGRASSRKARRDRLRPTTQPLQRRSPHWPAAPSGTWPPRPGSWDVLVNATSAGSGGPDDDPMAGVPLDGEIVFDLVYAPARTPLLGTRRTRRMPDDRRPRDARRAGGAAVRIVDRAAAARGLFEPRRQHLPPAKSHQAAVRGQASEADEFEEFVELARRGTFVPVVKEIIADLLTPVSAFLKIAEHSDYAFLFESVEGGEQVARYSFLGKDPFLVLRQRGGRTIIDRSGVTSESGEPFVTTLRRLMAEFQSPFVPGLPRFTGGAVGFIGYDASPVFEPALADAWAQAPWRSNGTADPQTEDDAGFMLFDTVLAFDHVKHRILIIANARVTADEDLERALSVRLREDSVSRTRARARAVAGRGRRRRCAGDPLQHGAGDLRSGRAHDQGAHCRRRHLPGGAVAALRSRRHAPIRSPSIERCATSIRRPTCISSGWAGCRSSDRHRRCWCASKDGGSRRIRSPARGRAARTTTRICVWPRS